MIRRKVKREQLEGLNKPKELLKILNHFFPEFICSLGRIKDPRDPRYITYTIKTILLPKILAAVFFVESMRGMTEEFNNTKLIQNVGIILNDKDLKELPYWETINDCLKRLNPSEPEKVKDKMVNRLIRMRTFEDNRIKGKYWQILVDGTGWFSTDQPHCEHCLTRTHKNEDGGIRNIEYYHNVLEAKLVLSENVVVSIGTEFLENESANIDKQDCEISGFYRMAKAVKQKYPRLPVCITVDSLYAGKPFFDLCEKYQWKYIVRFKDGSIPSIAGEFESLKDYDNTVYKTEMQTEDGNCIQEYRFVNDIDYGGYSIHEIECRETTEKGEAGIFRFITNIRITAKNHGEIVASGRRRWKIENQGFNTQKNHGYNMQHLFSHDFNAMKNHYYLIQIAHMISQLFESRFQLLREGKLTIKHLHKLLLTEFQTQTIMQSDLEEAKKQVRFAFICFNYTPGEVVIAR